MGSTREIKEVYIPQKNKKKCCLRNPANLFSSFFLFFLFFIPLLPSIRYKVFKIKITAHNLPGRPCVSPKNLLRLSSQGNEVELMTSSVATVRPKNNRNVRTSCIEHRIKCPYCRLENYPQTFPKLKLV